MKPGLFLSAAAALAVISNVTLADEAEVDAVVVTATRTPERLDRVGGQITVIDTAAIEARQSPVVSDILARTPGVQVTRNGGVGAATQVRIRGAETGHTVVLIDGVKLNDPSVTDSSYNFANLLVGEVSRIEVLRGAQSVLWGSQALGGVVNVLTEDPAEPFEASVKAEAGSFDTAYGRLSAGGRSDRASWRAGVGYYTSGGISAFNAARGGREADGYRNLGASAKARVGITDQLSLDLRAFYSRGRNEIDGFPAPTFTLGDTREYGITRDLVGYAGLNLDLLEGRFANRLAYAGTRTDRDNRNPDQAVTPVTFDSIGRNDRLEYQGTWKATDAWTAVFGFEHERSSFRSASPSAFDPNPTPGRRSARLDALYGQVSGEIAPGLVLGGGLRRDDHGDFGGHTVGQLSAAWRVGPAVFRTSYAEGFKAPSLYQLGSEYGNGALTPEQAETWDAGVQASFGPVSLSGAYFERRTTDMIDFVSCFGPPVAPLCLGASGAPRFGYYENLGRARARGVELQGQVRASDALSLNANYTWTESLNDTAGSANFGKRLARRPEHQANIDAEYVWRPGLTTGLSARYVGSSYDDGGNFNRLKSHLLWDILASYDLTDRVTLHGRVENLSDEAYETIRGYGEPGRAAYLGVRARF